MDLNRFGLDTVLAAGTESITPEIEPTTGTESITEEQLGAEIHELVEANESLDRMLHTGLVDGLESVSETLKLVQLSDTFHTMEAIAAGTESYDSDMAGLESALRYAGVDLSEISGYEAGMEAREGGLVQPLRSAGISIKGSKAYKAVADSWVGKASGAVVKKIKSIWNWIVEHIFGKTKKNSNKIIQDAIDAAGGDVSGAMSAMAETQAKMKEEIEKYSSAYVKEMDRANNANFTLSLVRNQLAQAKKEMQDMKADLELQLKNEKTRSSAIKYDKNTLTAENEKLRSENTDLKEERNQLSKESDALNNALVDKSREYAQAVARINCLSETLKTTFNGVVTKVDGLPEHAKKEVLNVVKESAEVEKLYLENASIVAKLKGFVKRNIKAGKRINKWKRGKEDLDFDLTNLIGFTVGSESMIEDMKEEFYEDGNESILPTSFITALAAYDILGAVEAGIECMNIDTFGHPYTGADMRTMQVIAFTDRYDLGEAGTEAEETKAEEKPSETAKKEESKEEGFFSKAGAKFKRAGKWVAAKGRQFWKWLKSKLTILEPMMDKLAMITSKSFDLSALNEQELGSALASIDANLEKVGKLLDKEHKEEVKSAEDYTKIIADSKKKVSSSITVSPIRLIGASDLLKKIRKISKAVKNASDNKAENATEMTSIMTETNKAIAAFNLQIRRALKNVVKVNEATKDLPDAKKAEKKEEPKK